MTGKHLRQLAIVAVLLLPSGRGYAQATGTIAGIVRTASAPVADALAILDGKRETRTDSAGRFRFDDVPVGRHTFEVRSIGTTPFAVNVIVAAGQTLEFEARVERIITLDSVRVEGSTVRQGFVRAYEDRKRVALGKFMDAAEVKRFGTVPQALLFIPGVRRGVARDAIYFTQDGALCLPNVWIDNQNWGTDQGVLGTMRPDDVAAVEVYTRKNLIPEEFTQRGRERGCGALVIWTKRFWPTGKG